MDKLELLLSVYSKNMPRRVTVRDYELFMKHHSSYRCVAAQSLSLTEPYPYPYL